MLGQKCQKPSFGHCARLPRPARISHDRSAPQVKAFLPGQKDPAKTKAASQTTVPVTFTVTRRVNFGEHLAVVGAQEQLGGWEVDSGLALRWSPDHVWSASVDVPAGSLAEFKLVHVIPRAAPQWEFVPNRQVAVAADAASLDVTLGWNDPEASAVAAPATLELAAKPEAAQGNLHAAAAAVDAFAEQMRSWGAAPAAGDAAEAALVAPLPEAVSVEAPAEEEIAVLEAAEAELAPQATPSSDFLKSAAKTAGAVALGVAGAAALSVLAIDIADTAMLGAMVAVAGGAVISGASTGGKRSKASAGSDAAAGDEAGEAGASQRITGAGEPGLYLAAGLMSALDAGKAIAHSLEAKPAAEVAEAAAEEEKRASEEA